MKFYMDMIIERNELCWVAEHYNGDILGYSIIFCVSYR